MKVFSDAVDALTKITKAVLGAKDVPKKERDRYRDLLHETFSLLDSAILLVIARLSDLLVIANEQDEGKGDQFVRDLRKLDNQPEWERLSREVRLCRSLRIASTELQRVAFPFLATFSLRDRKAVDELIDEVLEREYTLASFISKSLGRLAELADGAAKSQQKRQAAVEIVAKTRSALQYERDALIRAELSSFEAI